MAERIRDALTVLITLLLSVSVHEYSHALAAYKLGDDTAARQGRLTLNPFAHADLLGTIILPLLGALTDGAAFGWGRPVPYVPSQLTRRISLRSSEAIIAFAGPFANLVLAGFCTVALFALNRTPTVNAMVPLRSLLGQLLILNLTLFFFNLLPIPPLDGSRIFAWLFGGRADRALDSLGSLGFGGIMIAIVFGGYVIQPFVQMSVNLALRLISLA